MKLFIDSANIAEIRRYAADGVISGVTTNPSIIAKEGKPFIETLKEICGAVSGPVNAEVTASDTKTMIEQGKRLADISEQIIVKIPMTENGMAAVHALSSEGIRTTVTLVFSPSQALLAANAGAFYVAPFVGRLNDLSSSGTELVSTIRRIFSGHSIQTGILAASIRSPQEVVDIALAGADVATLPPSVFEKMFRHPMTDDGLARFEADWGKYSGMQW